MNRTLPVAVALVVGALLGFLAADRLSLARELSVLAQRVAGLEQRMGPTRAAAVGERPGGSVRTVSTDGAPIRGKPDAPITIVEFSDFQCPFCGRAQPTLARVLDEYPDDVRLLFRHMPLSFHKDAPLAHRASVAAGEQGRFWEMHDRIFGQQRDLSRNTLVAHAQAIGLDVARFQRDLDDPKLDADVERDLAEARELGITGTPAFFINGRLLSGAQPYSAFRNEIERELARRRS